MNHQNSSKNAKTFIYREREREREREPINILNVINVKLREKCVKSIFAFCSFLYLCTNSLLGNNLAIGTPIVVGANITFTISWENSWNASLSPSNWDAVWVFVKRQVCGGAQTWDHSLLSTVSANHSVTGGVLQVDAVTDGMGVFIRRSALGNGNIASATVTLALQTAANGVDNFQVFGMEMVNIPQGDFYIGDNSNGVGTGSGVNAYGFKSVLIDNDEENITPLANASAYKSNPGYGAGANPGVALPLAYPVGWNSFYCMKYEISQEQYASFLNSLTFTQQIARTIFSPASAVGTTAIATAANPSRNRIEIRTSGVSATTPAVYGCDLNNNNVYNEADDGQNIACNWLSWADLIAYLDWAALRPMTEFEYEKVCRGASPVQTPNEYAWCNTTILQAISSALTVATGGTLSETSTASGNGLCAYGGATLTTGPLRCGFAAGAATNKVQAGGSWFGAMEMSGNVWEQCIGGNTYNYSTFTNACGDGTLTAAGAANTAFWPPTGGGGAGGIIRGGGYDAGTSYQTISDCQFLGNNVNAARVSSIGGRGVR